MKRTFLGKNIPEPAPIKPKRRARPLWFGMLVLPMFMAGGLLVLQQQSLTAQTGPRTTGNALGRSIQASNQDGNRILGSVTPSPSAKVSPSASASPKASSKPIPKNMCLEPSGVTGRNDKGEVVNLTQVSEAFRRIEDKNGKATGYSDTVTLFPIIPAGIRGINPAGDNTLEAGYKDDPWCSQGFWTRHVAYRFVHKGLAFLNWFALAAATLLIMWAAILYISGFANEGNVKKAKGILIGALSGLAIVFLAKVIVYGAINVVSGETSNSIGSPIEITIE